MTIFGWDMSPIDVRGPDECWPWTAGKSQGYGSIRYNGMAVGVHRLTYEAHFGPIPPGMVVDHVCHNRDPNCPGNACKHRSCQNPAHLELATIGENRRRAPIAGVAKRNATKTRCPQDHPLSGDNLLNMKSGARICKECARIRRQAHRARVSAREVVLR